MHRNGLNTYDMENVEDITMYVAKYVKEILDTQDENEITELLLNVQNIAEEPLYEGLLDFCNDEDFEEIKDIIKSFKDFNNYNFNNIDNYSSFEEYYNKYSLKFGESDMCIDIDVRYLLKHPELLNNEFAMNILSFINGSCGYEYVPYLVQMDISEIRDLIKNNKQNE